MYEKLDTKKLRGVLSNLIHFLGKITKGGEFMLRLGEAVLQLVDENTGEFLEYYEEFDWLSDGLHHSFNLIVRTYPDGTQQFRYLPSLVDSGGVKRPVVSSLKSDSSSVDFRRSCYRSKTAIFDIARANTWDWFLTLTFSPEEVDRYDYDDIVGRMDTFMQYLRRNGCQWLVVPELHKDGAYHFHGLCLGQLPLKDSGHLDPGGHTIYNIPGYKLGFTTVTEVQDQGRVSSYITKYTTKELLGSIPSGRKRYWASRSLQRVKIEKLEVSEKDFELILARMRYVRRIQDEFGNEIIVAEGKNVNHQFN